MKHRIALGVDIWEALSFSLDRINSKRGYEAGEKIGNLCHKVLKKYTKGVEIVLEVNTKRKTVKVVRKKDL